MADKDDLIAELEASKEQFEHTEAAHDASSARALAAALAALAAQIPPGEVVERSPFSDTHLRKKARLAGIEPSKRGPKGAEQ